MCNLTPTHGSIQQEHSLVPAFNSTRVSPRAQHAAPYRNFSTMEMLTRLGISVDYHATVVPTELGLALMWFAEDAITHCCGISNPVEAQKRQRTFNRVISLLRDRGSTPEIAIIKTDEIAISVNTITAAHEGQALSGPLAGKALESLEPGTVFATRSRYQHPETRMLIEGWYSLARAAQRCQKRADCVI